MHYLIHVSQQAYSASKTNRRHYNTQPTRLLSAGESACGTLYAVYSLNISIIYAYNQHCSRIKYQAHTCQTSSAVAVTNRAHTLYVHSITIASTTAGPQWNVGQREWRLAKEAHIHILMTLRQQFCTWEKGNSYSIEHAPLIEEVSYWDAHTQPFVGWQ